MKLCICYITILFFFSTNLVAQTEGTLIIENQTLFHNDIPFKYSVSYSERWQILVYETENDDISITRWKLPNVLRFFENDRITIKAYKNLASLNDEDRFYYEVSENTNTNPAGLYTTRIENGIEIVSEFSYTKQKEYYIVKNSRGYVISLHSNHHETYEENLPLFEAFFKNIQFELE